MKKLTELQLEQGRFVDGNKRAVEASIVGVAVARARCPELFFVEDRVPSEADAFCQGEPFNYNADAGPGYAQYVAPTVFLKIKEESPSADTGN